MRARFRQLAVNLAGSYWFIPALLTALAAALSVATWWFDTRYQLGWLTRFAYFAQARPEGARTILSAIATSMISVAGTVFAITFAAVVYASGNYGPRLLTNFMNDRGNQLSLGVFIATYVFALLTLRTIRLPSETGADPGGAGFVPELSMLVALLLALLSVGVLVFFLHHVPSSIRINNVVAGVGRTILGQVAERYPNPYTGDVVAKGLAERGVPLLLEDTGYLEVVDFSTLSELAGDQDLAVRLTVRTGDFVHPGLPVAYVQGVLTGDGERRLRSAFAVGPSRTANQDIEFSLDELVEIALRALSPGINDPFTAITCIHWMAAALASLGGRSLARDSDGRIYGADRVYCLADEFDHFVRRSAVAMSVGVASNDLASLNFVAAMAGAAPSCATPGRRRELERATAGMVEQARLALEGPALDRLEAAWERARPEFEEVPA